MPKAVGVNTYELSYWTIKKKYFAGHASANPSKNLIQRMIRPTQFAAFIMHEMKRVWH